MPGLGAEQWASETMEHYGRWGFKISHKPDVDGVTELHEIIPAITLGLENFKFYCPDSYKLKLISPFSWNLLKLVLLFSEPEQWTQRDTAVRMAWGGE